MGWHFLLAPVFLMEFDMLRDAVSLGILAYVNGASLFGITYQSGRFRGVAALDVFADADYTLRQRTGGP